MNSQPLTDEPYVIGNNMDAEAREKIGEVVRTIDSLLDWAITPWPMQPFGFGDNPLTPEWLTAEKRGISKVMREASRRIPSRWLFDGRRVIDVLFNVNRHAIPFAELLQQHPEIAKVSVESWPVKRYREMFDDLSAARRQLVEVITQDDDATVIRYSRHHRVDEWLTIFKKLGHQMSEDTFLRRRTGKAVPKIGVNPNSTRSSISLLIADLPDGYTGEMTR